MKKRRVLVALAVLVPLALFFVARVASGRRPQLVHQSSAFREIMWVSPQARWMLCDGGSPNIETLIDLRSDETKPLSIQGEFLRYTPDESAFLVRLPGALALYELPAGRLKQRYALPANFAVNDVHFSADGTLTAVNETLIVRWNVQSGALLERRAYNPDYQPLMGCGTRPNFFFSSAQISGFSFLSQDGTRVNSGNKWFSVATGQMIGPQEENANPFPLFDIDSSKDVLRISDRQSGRILLKESSLRHYFTMDNRWLINLESESNVQIIDTRFWKVAKRRNFSRGADAVWDGAPDFLLTVDDRGRVWRWRLR